MNFRYLQYSSGSNITASPDDMGFAHHIEPTASIDFSLPTAVEGMRVKIVHAGASNTITVKDGAGTVASLAAGQECYLDTRINSSGVPGWPTGAVIVGSDGVIDSDSVPTTTAGVFIQQAGVDVPSSIDLGQYTTINFASGATVAEGAAGVADVSITGGSGISSGTAMAIGLL